MTKISGSRARWESRLEGEIALACGLSRMARGQMIPVCQVVVDFSPRLTVQKADDEWPRLHPGRPAPSVVFL